MSGKYRLPVDAIIETMKEHADLSAWQARISAEKSRTKERCLAELIIGQGQLHSCVIGTSDGRVLFEQQEAYTVLQTCADLDWALHPIDQMCFARSSTLQESPPVRRVDMAAATQLQTLAHTHQHVYALVDGIKTVDYIAQLLTRSPADIRAILHDLQALHLIMYSSLSF